MAVVSGYGLRSNLRAIAPKHHPRSGIIKHEKTKSGLTIDHLVWCENLHPRRLVYRGSSSGSVTPAIGAIAHRLLCCSFILTRLVLGQTEGEATPRK
jgi:hypothetical protein